jgi:hypothetical protein
MGEVVIFWKSDVEVPSSEKKQEGHISSNGMAAWTLRKL